MTKTCENCGIEFSRSHNYSPSTFAKRRFCGRKCSANARVWPESRAKNECHTCGKTYRRSNHRIGKFCSRTCSGISQRAIVPPKRLDKKGYVITRIYGDDVLYSMASKNGYVREHRLVMARALKRPLERDETVHHINGDRTDNRLENLELWVGSHGAGLRAEDALSWAHEIIERYEGASPLVQQIFGNG